MAFNEEDYLQISGIQHYMFCPRRWALMYVEDQWSDNALTISGHIAHENVHNDKSITKKNGIITMRELHIKSHQLGLSGDCDAVEFTPSPNGVKLHNYDGLYDIQSIEYKHGNGMSIEADKMQAIAQTICLEEMFCCNINYVSLFYFGTKRREKIEITQADRDRLQQIVNEMHNLLQNKHTPQCKPKKYCKSCSLYDICMPQLYKYGSVSKYIEDNL